MIIEARCSRVSFLRAARWYDSGNRMIDECEIRKLSKRERERVQYVDNEDGSE